METDIKNMKNNADKWYQYYLDKPIPKHCGSNRDQAFIRGFFGFTLSNNRCPYQRNTALYYIYLAGKKLKRFKSKNKQVCDERK